MLGSKPRRGTYASIVADHVTRVTWRMALRHRFALTARSIVGTGKISQPCHVKNSDRAVFDLQEPRIGEFVKRAVGVLPRKAGQPADFFLRKTQRRIRYGIELRIEQLSKTESDSC
jgi:hypothetical protein